MWRGKDAWNELAPICFSPPFPSAGLLYFLDVIPEAAWATGTSPCRCRRGTVCPRTMVTKKEEWTYQFFSSFILPQPRGAGSLLRSKSLVHPFKKYPSPKVHPWSLPSGCPLSRFSGICLEEGNHCHVSWAFPFAILPRSPQTSCDFLNRSALPHFPAPAYTLSTTLNAFCDLAQVPI